jgi:WD40 repeat protein
LLLQDHTNDIYDVAWSASGDRLASASYDHTVGLWNTASIAKGTVTLIARLQGHLDQVRTVAFHPDGATLVSGGKDQTIRQWRTTDGRALGVLARATHKVSALSFFT